MKLVKLIAATVSKLSLSSGIKTKEYSEESGTVARGNLRRLPHLWQEKKSTSFTHNCELESR